MMRKLTLTLAFSLLIGLIHAQTNTLDGFLKSKWGSSKAEVIENNSVKGYSYYESEDVSDDMLVVIDADFAGVSNCLIIWQFTSDKLFQGSVSITPELSAKAMTEYKNMRDKIDGKYTEGKTYEYYDYPYEEGDGHWETAFKLGKGHLSTYWRFDDGNSLSMQMTEDLSFTIKYQSSELIKEAIKKQKDSHNDDL